MNSLQELNTYGATIIDYIDNRDPEIIFDRLTPTNQTITVNQHSKHNVPVGINVIDIYNPNSANTKYKIDISNNPDATLDFGTLPSGLSLSNPAPGIYLISGITDPSQWDSIKSPIVIVPLEYTGEFIYQATVQYTNKSSVVVNTTWSIDCSVVTAPFLTAPSDMYLPKTLSANTRLNIAGAPLIQDEYPTQWELRISGLTLSLDSAYKNTTYPNHPNAGTLPSFIPAGTAWNTHTYINGVDIYGTYFSYNVLFGTKDQINASIPHLYNVSGSNRTFNDDITLTWTAVNVTTTEIGTATHTLQNTKYLTATRSSDSYSLNAIANITGGPQANTYASNNSMTIIPSNISALGTLSAVGSYDYSNSQSLDLITLNTNDSSLSGTKILHFSSTVEIAPNSTVSGTYIPSGTIATVTSSTTITLSKAITGDITSETAITFTAPAVRETVVSDDGKYMAYSTITPSSYATITGSVTTGSHSITGSFGSVSLSVGDVIDGPYLPSNSKIVSFSSTVINVSTTATGTSSGISFHLLRTIASVQVYSRNNLADNFTLLQIIYGSKAEYAKYGSKLQFTSDASRLLVSTPSYTDANGSKIGYVEVYTKGTTTYSLENTFIPSYTGATDIRSAAISADGTTIAIADSPYIGGTVSVYTRSGTTWTQKAYWNPYSADTAYYTNGGKPLNINLSSNGYTLSVDDTANTYVYTRDNIGATSWTFVRTIGGHLCTMTYDGLIIYVNLENSLDPTIVYTKVYSKASGSWTEIETISGSSATINGQNNTRIAYVPGSTTATSYYKIYTQYASEWIEVVSFTKSTYGTLVLKAAADGDCVIIGYSAGAMVYQGFTNSGVSWNDSTKTLTLSGSTAFINVAIDTIQLIPAADYNSNITLTYTLKDSGGTTLDSRTQLITYTS